MASSLTSFSDSEIRMRYREPYATAGLNAKLAVNTPRGTYRGFRLAPHAADDTVTVESDPTYSDHVLVYESLDGYSVTIRREGGDFALDLSTLVDASEKVWVLCVYAVYTVGSTTTAEIRAYEYYPTDEFTPAPENGELVVLGTVVIPASGGVPIPDDNINHDRRTSAYQARAPEDVAWRPVLENSGFEAGGVSVVYGDGDYGIERWALQNTKINYSLTTSDVGSGTKSLLLAMPSGGNYSGDILYQDVGVLVSEGQRVRIQLLKKSFADSPTGTTDVEVYARWYDADWTLLSDEVLPLVDLNNTSGDSSYISIDKTLVAPSGANALKGVGIRFTGSITPGTVPLSPWLQLDSFQCWVESPSAEYAVPEGNDRRALWGTDLVLLDGGEDYDGYFGRKAGIVRYDANVGYALGGGRVSLETATTGVKIPEFSPKGRITEVGSDYLDTDDNSRLIPRVAIPTREWVLTLLQEEGLSGDVKRRTYVYSESGAPVETYITVNAKWNGSTWVSDAACMALLEYKSKSGFYWASRTCTSVGETWTSFNRSPLTLHNLGVSGDWGSRAVELGRCHPMSYAPLVVNAFGALHYRGFWWNEEFIYEASEISGAAPVGIHWEYFTSASTVTGNYNDETAVRLDTGTAALLYTTLDLIRPTDNPGFTAKVMSVDSGGSCNWWIGYVYAADFNIAFVYDNTTDPNIHVGIDNGTGAVYHDTGISGASIEDDWIVLNIYVLDPQSTSCKVLWNIQTAGALTDIASGYEAPGVAAQNTSQSHGFQFLCQGGADLIVDSLVCFSNTGD